MLYTAIKYQLLEISHPKFSTSDTIQTIKGRICGTQGSERKKGEF